MMNRHKRPFRLGATSYIIPDDIIPNLRHLAGRVDDVELVLFESDQFSNIPSLDDVSEMRRILDAHAMSCTVHLPLDTRLGDADEAERTSSVGKCLRVIDRMAPLDPFGWILHMHGDQRGETPSDDMPRWLSRHAQSLKDIIRSGLDPAKLCVETLDYDYALIADIVLEHACSVCLDIGHLLNGQRDVDAHLDRWLARTRVYHLHGVKPGGIDHADLSYLPPGFLDAFMTRIARGAMAEPPVVTIEVFGEADFEQSMAVLNERLRSCQN